MFRRRLAFGRYLWDTEIIIEMGVHRHWKNTHNTTCHYFIYLRACGRYLWDTEIIEVEELQCRAGPRRASGAAQGSGRRWIEVVGTRRSCIICPESATEAACWLHDLRRTAEQCAEVGAGVEHAAPIRKSPAAIGSRALRLRFGHVMRPRPPRDRLQQKGAKLAETTLVAGFE